MSQTNKIFLSLAVVLSLAAFFISFRQKPSPVVEGSVIPGGEYQSTTTPQVIANWPAIAQIVPAGAGVAACASVCPGILGSVIITKTDTGAFAGYDATTTDVNKRAASMASSSILMFSFVASPTAGTYVFDSSFRNGLIVVSQGTMSSTTITYRQYGGF